MSQNKKRFFKYKGKDVNTVDKELVNTLATARETVSSLSELKIETADKKTFSFDLDGFKQLVRFLPKFDVVTTSRWGTAFVGLSFVLIAFVFKVPILKAQQLAPEKYSVFSSTPLTIENVDTRIVHIDSKAERIDSIFRKYKCPLAGFGQVFVDEAEKNEIPYWLLPAMAFQESSCGKNTPVVDGIDTYNLFGWAVWGENVHGFDSYEHAIQTVSKYMYTKFYSQNITELCDIMKVYTPPSNGSWCQGVGYFAEEIESYSTPLDQ